MVLSVEFQANRRLSKNTVFGDCGKIIIGAIIDKEIGELGICRTPKEQCPRLDKEMDDPFGEVIGDPIYIRKLK